jgi:hypothetical protein
MTDGDLRGDALQPSALEIGFIWYYRLISLYCLLFGIGYWTRLIGYHEGAAWRFDLMPYYWQVASASLAVLYPIAAIGLWMTASWGPVLWVFCAGGELIMFLGLSEMFGTHNGVVAAHLVVAAIYAAFRFALHRQRKQAAQ